MLTWRLLNAQRLLTWRQMSVIRMLMWRQMDAKRMLMWRLLDAQNYEDSNFFCIYRWEGVRIRIFYLYRGCQGEKPSIYQKFLSSDRPSVCEWKTRILIGDPFKTNQNTCSVFSPFWVWVFIKVFYLNLINSFKVLYFSANMRKFQKWEKIRTSWGWAVPSSAKLQAS